MSPEPAALGEAAPPRPRRRLLRRLLLAAGALLGAGVLAAGVGLAWLWITLRGSLPATDGRLPLAGLAAQVTVERDARGVPTLSGSNRADLARATGFLHAQERYFQMDLMRRRAAGELSELFGEGALPADRGARLHGFRALARRVVDRAEPPERALLDAYAEGVNAGLSALGSRPPEYLLLRAEPAPWRPEDTALVLLSMFLLLQDDAGERESSLAAARAALPAPLFAFVFPAGTEWDAPLEGDPFETPPVPGPEILDLRTAAGVSRAPDQPDEARASALGERLSTGSNNWVVSAKRTRDGRAILADDMHLPLSVPNTWYRLSLVRPGEGGGGDRITGLTLPGTPAIIAGSNGRVAWGFTNSYGDWSDVVLIDPAPDGADRYLTPGGPRAFERRTERIKVRGAAEVSFEVSSTIWGPVIGAGGGQQRRALRWVAHDPEGVNFRLMRMEQAGSVDEALELAPQCGVPAQNLVVADAGGRIGWTILGRIPRRVGFDGAEPVSWADGTRRWEGWLAPSECPRIVDPPGGILWTANARTVSGASLRLLGDGGYMLGARAAQIRDDLRGLTSATERDMLAVELDDRARFLDRWRGLLLDALTPAAVAADPRRGEARTLVEGWGGRASIDSAGYRLVHAFRSELARQVLSAIAAPYRARLPELDLAAEPQSEGPVWRLVKERPAHLLDPRFRDWEGQVLAAADAVIKELSSRGPRLADRTWGERNLAQIRHPLSRAVPALGRWLDMPAVSLAGDNHMPRVQGPSFGASERMIVSPGHEEDGLFHMPCGQSGHPLSPHYADGQEAWVKGEATAFLPGPPIHTLSLVPGP